MHVHTILARDSGKRKCPMNMSDINVDTGYCLAVDDEDLKICHVCNRSVESRCEGVYAHWRLGATWDAYICLLREDAQLESADDSWDLV